MINRGLLLIALSACLAAPVFSVAEAQPVPRQRPEPVNHSRYLSDADFVLFRSGLDAADDENWVEVRRIRDQISDSAARDLLLWRMALNDPRTTFFELNMALDTLDNWPRDSFIRSEAESKIATSGLSAAFIQDWFEEHPPMSGMGMIAQAEALLELGLDAEATALIRTAWQSRRFASEHQRDVFRAHGDRLRPQDHAARTDYLIWTNQRTLARRMVGLLSGSDRALADARLRLAGRQSGVDAAVNRVPASLQNDPGLVFERARWRRRSGLRDDALPLLLQLPDAHGNTTALERMWTERKLSILTLIRDQDYQTAYDLAAAHGMSRGADFADAEFVSGWLALVHLDQPGIALGHFTHLRENVTSPVSTSRAWYWMARAADAMGNADQAAQYYEAAGEHSTAYYGQLALTALHGDEAVMDLGIDPVPSEEARLHFETRPQVRAMHLLAEQGEDYYFRLFIYRMDDTIDNPQEAVLLAELANDYLYTRQSVRAAKAARQNGMILPESAYPTISLPDSEFIAPEDALVHSVIRQETEFSQRAVSGAGARGMMQLMPATARQTARSLGEPYRFNWLTDDLDYNLTLGMAHLGEVVEDYDGSYVVALAAYNAGGHRARQWIEAYGDPRDPDVDPIDWVESIPFSETRNYVMRVMENLQVYRSRLNADESTPLLIEDDLDRGSTPQSVFQIHPGAQGR